MCLLTEKEKYSHTHTHTVPLFSGEARSQTQSSNRNVLQAHDECHCRCFHVSYILQQLLKKSLITVEQPQPQSIIQEPFNPICCYLTAFSLPWKYVNWIIPLETLLLSVIRYSNYCTSPFDNFAEWSMKQMLLLQHNISSNIVLYSTHPAAFYWMLSLVGKHSAWHQTAGLCRAVGRLLIEVSANEGALMTQTKCAIQQGFPKQARGLEEWLSAWLSESRLQALHCWLCATMADFLPAIQIDKGHSGGLYW